MEDQNWQNRSDHDSLAKLESVPEYTYTNNLINNCSNTNASHNQLGVSSGQFVEHEEDGYPPGYRFKPYDFQLIEHYLRKKIMNEPLPCKDIHQVELYKFNPETLTEIYKPCGEKEWYFLTPRDRKYPNGDRPNRAAGDGYWKATGADKPVTYGGKIYGSKKTLVFYRGRAPGGDKTNWIMHEFKDNDSVRVRKRTNNGMRLDDWVLCRIHNKTDGPPRNNRINVQEDVIEIEDEPLEYNENLVAHENADQVVVPTVAGNYNPGSQLGYGDTYGNSANHQNSQTGWPRVSQGHALPANHQNSQIGWPRVSQDHALPANHQNSQGHALPANHQNSQIGWPRVSQDHALPANHQNSQGHALPANHQTSQIGWPRVSQDHALPANHQNSQGHALPANHQTSQIGWPRVSQDHALPANHQNSQGHALPSFPQSLDLPIEQSSSHVQRTIPDDEIGSGSFELDDELNIYWSLPSLENIDQFLLLDNNDLPPSVY